MVIMVKGVNANQKVDSEKSDKNFSRIFNQLCKKCGNPLEKIAGKYYCKRCDGK